MKLWILLLTLAAASGAFAQTHLGVLSIDGVTNEISDTQLQVGRIHRASIRFDLRNNPSICRWNTQNGFEIYSPDGADWGYFKGSDGPLVTALPQTIRPMRIHRYSTDNGLSYRKTEHTGADSAGGSAGSNTRAAYSLCVIDFYDVGFVGGTDNDIAVVLEFTSNRADIGLHLCIDTMASDVAWEWAAPVTGSDFPLWDNGLGVSGPRCWELLDPCLPVNAPPNAAAAPNGDCASCCTYHVGDPDGSDGNIPTIADISRIIDAKFMRGTCDAIIGCLAEADVNQSGGINPTCDDITIGDISMLIDYLFITGPQAGMLPECL